MIRIKVKFIYEVSKHYAHDDPRRYGSSEKEYIFADQNSVDAFLEGINAVIGSTYVDFEITDDKVIPDYSTSIANNPCGEIPIGDVK